MQVWPNLSDVLGDIHWAVVGAVGMRLYAPERTTADLDIVIGVQDHAACNNALLTAGWKRRQELSIGGTTWETPEGIEVVVLTSDATWLAEALSQAEENLDRQGLPILPLPYLALMKFQAGRTLDLADLTRMLGLASEEDLDRTRTLFADHELDALDDLESLMLLGRLEMKPPPDNE